MRIGIAFDLVPIAPETEGPDDRYEEFDQPETIEALAEVLRSEGHEILLLGDGREFLTRVLADPPDFVWNIAEGEGTGRNREARVPAVLEMLGIPYSGSDPLTLAAALDKGVARQLMSATGRIKVPFGSVLPAGLSSNALKRFLQGMGFWDGCDRLIIKPCFEGSSKGIRSDCVADTMDQAVTRYRDLAHVYNQPILIEEFIAGDEVTVGIVGNGTEAQVLGVMRIKPKRPDDRFVYSIEVKRDWDERVEYETPAQLSAEVLERVHESALLVYHALGCRDLARIDFRVRGDAPYFIEANPLPGLAPGWSDLVILAQGMQIKYADLIRRVLNESLIRVGLKPSPGLGTKP